MRILSTILLAGALSAMSAGAAFSSSGAAVINYDGATEQAEESEDSTQQMTEIEILSDAQIYFDENDLHFPLEDLQDTDDYRAWVDSATTVLKLFPDDPEALSYRALGNTHLGRYEAAVDDALRGICDDLNRPHFEDIVLYIAGIEPGLTERKVNDLTAAYMANPDPQNADGCMVNRLMLRSALCRQHSRNAEAYEAARLAHELDPRGTDEVLMMSTILLRAGQSDLALKLLEPLYNDEEVEYYEGVLHNYTLALRNTGRIGKAIEILKKSIEDIPSNADLRLQYASMLALDGKADEAAEIFDKAAQEYAEYAIFSPGEGYDIRALEAKIRLAMLLISEGNEADGKVLMQQVLDECEQYEVPTGFETTAAGWLGDRATVEKYLKAYGNVAPSSKASAYCLLGDFPTALKYVKEAFDCYDLCPEAVKYDPNFRKLLSLPEYQRLAKEFKKPEMK